MSKHTPGPWKIYKIPSTDGGWAISSSKSILCDEIGTILEESNARLIAESPAMLELRIP